MNYNDTSAANELKKIIVALGGADSIYDIPGQKSDDVIRDLAKAVENAIANGTIGGNSGPTAEWGEPEELIEETEINILTAPEDDTSEEFLKKIADDSKNRLTGDYDNNIENIFSSNMLVLKIEGQYYQFPVCLCTRLGQVLRYGNYTMVGYVTDATERFRLYLGTLRDLDGETEVTIIFCTIVDQTAKKDYSVSVGVFTPPALLRVSGSWHYSLVNAAKTGYIPPLNQEYVVILFEPLKHQDFGELSLMVCIYEAPVVAGQTVNPIVVWSTWFNDFDTIAARPIPGLNIGEMGYQLSKELGIAFHHVKDVIPFIDFNNSEGRLTYTLSL